MGRTIGCVGSVNADLVLQMDHVPKAGESLLGDRYSVVPGGKGGNQAVAAAKVGGSAWFCGCVGKDAYATMLRSSLESSGVKTGFLRETDDAPSGIAVIMLEADGQNRIIVYAGANMKVAEEQIRSFYDGVPDLAAVIVNLEITEAAVRCTIAEGARRGIPVIVDAGPAHAMGLDALKGATIVSPNETESEALTGITVKTPHDAEAAAKAIVAATGCTWAVIKMGGQGAYVYGKEKSFASPAFPVKPVDTTAAGDAFTAGLVVGYLEHGGDIAAALPIAHASGAITVTRLGAQPSIPTRAEIDRFLAERRLKG